jgi:hypothetical protein
VDLPNKQNDMCAGRSTWDVISSNEDFSAEDFLPTETAPDTVFTVVRPSEGRFVLVLDVSGSMDDFDRINRLKQSATRWIRHDITDGTLLGITSFRYRNRVARHLNSQSQRCVVKILRISFNVQYWLVC